MRNKLARKVVVVFCLSQLIEIAGSVAGLAQSTPQPNASMMPDTGGKEAGSNLTAPYPDPECQKPRVPEKPIDLARDPDEVAVYDAEILKYNARLSTYIGCMKAYIATSNSDIRLIQAKVQAAITDANTP